MLLRSIKPIVLLGAAWTNDFDDKLRSSYAMLQHNDPQHDWQILLTLPAHTFNPNGALDGSLCGSLLGNPKNYPVNFGCVSLDTFPR